MVTIQHVRDTKEKISAHVRVDRGPRKSYDERDVNDLTFTAFQNIYIYLQEISSRILNFQSVKVDCETKWYFKLNF